MKLNYEHKMVILKQFQLKNILSLFLLYNLILEYVKADNVIKGYFYNIFTNDNNQLKLIKDNIKTNFEENWNKKKFNKEYTIDITFSESKNYQNYIEYEVKKELNDKNYDFFLIDLNNLYSDYETYKKIVLNYNNNKKNKNEKRSNKNKNKKSNDFIFSNIIPLDYDLGTGHFDSNILDDCKLNDVYYALPFCASYHFLFYNTYYVNNIAKEIVNENITWDDIERIITAIFNSINNSNVEGIKVSLDNKEKITSLYLEGLFANSTIYNKCSIDYRTNNKYFNFNNCVSSREIFYSEKSESWIKKIKSYIEKNYINEKCFEPEDEFSYKRDSIFYIGNSDDYRIYQYLLNESAQQNGDNMNYSYYDVTLLPGKYSTYNSYVLVGNRQIDDNRKKIVSDVINILSSENAQIQRAQILNLTPTFNFIEYENTILCENKNIPCNLLKKINPISLTKTLFNRESVSNNEMFEFISSYLKDKNTTKNFKKEMKNYLTLVYTKYNSVVGIIDISYFLIGNIYALILIILILINKNKNSQIKRSSPMICILFILGITCSFYFPIFNISIPTKLSCTFNHYFMDILLSVALSCYLVKVWRIHYILNSYKSKIFGIRLSDYSLSSIITAIITIELLLNILWDVVSPRNVGVLSIQTSERITNCTSEHDFFFKAFTYAVNILMVIININMINIYNYYYN